MSQIIFANINDVNYFENDLRLLPLEIVAEFSLDVRQVADAQWPRSSQDEATSISDGTDILAAQWYEWNDDPSTGSESGFTVTGLAKDNTGAVLASATVKLYRTSTDEMVSTGTSDTDGSYILKTPYSGNHYVVAYKAGSPDVAGTSVNTLTGV